MISAYPSTNAVAHVRQVHQVVAVVYLLFYSVTATNAEGIRLLPEHFTLSGKESRQQVSVVRVAGPQTLAMLSEEELSLTVQDPSVVRIDDGVVFPVSDGTTTIAAQLGDQHAAVATVTVTGTDEQHRWSFRNDVQSVLSKVGCNMGACHGALAGKGGFCLSLRGYDPNADFLAITRDANGRRVEVAAPATSLLLTKPTGAVPHKGGIRLDPNTRDYRVLAEWIASGTPGPRPEDRHLTRISVLPAFSSLKPGEQTQILVSGHYDDGSTIDVTHWARYNATDATIASVTDDGKVSIQGSGEGAILVWFGSKVALARLTVPYEQPVADDLFAASPRRNFIDELNLEQLSKLQLAPAPRCDDATFLRRACLTTIGRPPTTEEYQRFHSDDPSQRRDNLIDSLLASEDYADYWAYRMSDLLLVSGVHLPPAAVESYYQWIHESVQQNKPWNQFVREILTAVGRSDENGATNFYGVHQSPEELTENACQAFLGLSIGCAKCHNHPLEKWTNDQYYAMANLFARVRTKGWGGDIRNAKHTRTVTVASTGDLIQPNKGKPQPPAPLDGVALDFDDPADRRIALADWMTDSSNPYFSRAIANRIWSNFLGQGLVEPVDDLRLSNPASNEPLLQALADHLVASNYDLKQLMRAILQSETFQRASDPSPLNAGDERYFARYYPRRMMAEVMLDSIDQVLQTSTAFEQIALPGAEIAKTSFYPQGTRAIELYDSAVVSYFLKSFGRNPREITCECERSNEPSVTQVLHLTNGSTLNDKLARDDNYLSSLVAEQKTDREILMALFIAALSREPTAAELDKLHAVIGEYGEDRETALRDAAWSILTSSEFTFIH